MKLKYIILPIIATSFAISSCNNFLDREPLTDNVNEGFSQNQANCRLIVTRNTNYCPISKTPIFLPTIKPVITKQEQIL